MTTSNRTVVFRTQGGHREGMGDVWGALAAADSFDAEGWTCRFVLSRDGASYRLIKSKGYDVRVCEDLDEEVSYLASVKPEAVLFIKLDNDPDHVRAITSAVPVVVTVDDTGPAAALADIRINVLYHVEDAETGPEYITLRQEFREARARVRPPAGDVRQILITQGGSDTYGQTPLILKALPELGPDVRIVLVLGHEYQHLEALSRAVASIDRDVRVIEQASSMSELMLESDLAVTSGGITMYELACLGVPSLVVYGDDYEEESARRLEEAGATVNLGSGRRLDYSVLPERVRELVQGLELRQAMARKGMNLVDGRGCDRIARLVIDRVSGLLAL